MTGEHEEDRLRNHDIGPATGSHLHRGQGRLPELDIQDGRVLEDIHNMSMQGASIMDERQARNPADFPVLGVLRRGPTHGYDLCRELRQQLGEVWTLRTSHIYALLAGLERDGLASHQRIDQEKHPAKKVFEITDKGRELFSAWVHSPVRNVRDIRLEFLAKLFFARQDSPEAAARLIADQISVCRGFEKRLRQSRQACNTHTERATLDFRLAVVEATVAWMQRMQSPGDQQLEETGWPGHRQGFQTVRSRESADGVEGELVQEPVVAHHG